MREDIEFKSKGTVCRGWFSRPEHAPRPAPLVLMAHGFGGTRDMDLEPYAERFQRQGYATLIFDYRSFGASDGTPRNLLDPKREVDDWHAALAYARSLPFVDATRIVLWGTSFSGGLVLRVAAQDGKVAASISQCPLLDGRAAAIALARYAGVRGMLRVGAHGVYDLMRAAVGAEPHYMPIVAKPGALGAMSSADAYAGFMRLAPPGFRNEVTARTGLFLPSFRPITDAAAVRCPALLQICEQDSVAPIAPVEKAARSMPRAELVRYPVGHFDVYQGAPFERSVADQLAFLKRHVG